MKKELKVHLSKGITFDVYSKVKESFEKAYSDPSIQIVNTATGEVIKPYGTTITKT